MAQELLRQLCPKTEAFSRGLYVDPEYTVPAKVQYFLTRQGLTPAPHTPTQLAAPDMANADLVLLMEQSQLEQVLDTFAEYTDKCYLLLDYAYGREADLADPIGLEGRAFEKQAALLKRAVQACAQRLGA